MGLSKSSISLFLLFSACVVRLNGVSADECSEAINIGNNRRSAVNLLGSHEDPLSDMSVDPNAWYSFVSSAGNKIPEFCVHIYHCGTNSPIWVNGTHPSAAQVGPVTLQVCSQLRCDEDCCGWSSTVQAKWCKNATTDQEYYVYRLTPPPDRYMSYCAGNITYCGVSCKWDAQTSTCDCPPQPPMTKPNISDPYISAAKTTLDPASNSFIATKFSINCTVGYPRQEVDDGARFDILFEANGVHLVKFVATSTSPVAILDELYLNGYLGTNITCKVFPYWQSKEPDQTVFQVSEEKSFGVIPVDESGREITSVVILQEGEIFRFKMVPNFPITAPSCLNMSLDIPCHPYYTFKIYARNDGLIDACAFELIPSSNASDFIAITPAPTIGKRAANFTWEISFEKKTENTIFYNYQIRSVIVLIQDPVERPMCKSAGDPHINTFPNVTGEPKPSIYYHVYTMGDYYLVKATTRLFEVQVRHFACMPAVTCNCGVMVREGNNIVGIDFCQPQSKEWDPRLIRLLVDKAFPSGSITSTATGWLINMLSGVEIKVDRGSLFGIFDIYVIGLNNDNYTGLCTYTGPNEAMCTTECDRYRVPEENSLFNFNSTNLPKCYESYGLPSCECNSRDCDNYCNTTDLSVDQSNLLKTNLACAGTLQFNAINEEYVDLDVIVNVTIKFKYNSTVGTNVAFTWPTAKNGISQQQATEQCRTVLSNSSAQSVCGSRSDIDVDSMITGCVLDIQISDNLAASSSISTQFESSCEYSIKSGLIETNDPNDLQKEIHDKMLEIVLSNICPRLCSLRGTCVNGTCVCNPGFSGKSCGLTEGQVPAIQNLFATMCDIKQKPCSQIQVKAADVAFTETLTCKLNSTIDGIQFDYSPIVAGGVIFCSLPTKPNVDVYYVSLSNDRKIYSPAEKFTVFSSEDTMPIANPAA